MKRLLGFTAWFALAGLLVLGNVLESDLAPAVHKAIAQAPFPVTSLSVTSSSHWSDQSSFVAAGVPTLFLYGYQAAVHHTRRDTADRVNAAGGAAVARLVYRILQTVDNRPVQPGPAGRQAKEATDPAVE